MRFLVGLKFSLFSQGLPKKHTKLCYILHFKIFTFRRFPPIERISYWCHFVESKNLLSFCCNNINFVAKHIRYTSRISFATNH